MRISLPRSCLYAKYEARGSRRLSYLNIKTGKQGETFSVAVSTFKNLPTTNFFTNYSAAKVMCHIARYFTFATRPSSSSPVDYLVTPSQSWKPQLDSGGD